MTISDYEMTEDEYKNFKVKHRNSEEKSMLEADTKYLKAIFDIYDKRMSGGNPSIGMAPVSVDNSFRIPNIVDVSV